MIGRATLRLVAFSIPNPGEALTSRINGPRAERMRSTPATWRPMTLAALIASFSSSGVSLIAVPMPPLWRLERKSSSRD